MRALLRSVLTAVFALIALAAPLAAQQAASLLGVRVDADRNKLLLEIPIGQLDKDLLHQITLATGAGVSSLGLDRAQIGGESVIRFERRGRRVLMVQDNLQSRAIGADAAGQRAAAESFPRSVSASFPIESDTGGKLVVDATSFFLSDAYGIGEGLRRSQQGTARVDAARSWFDAARTKSFPLNVEIHAVLTFNVDNAGPALRRNVPDASAPVFELHHSIVALPAVDGYTPRAFDARSGYFGTGFYNFAQGLDGLYRDGFINRWRLIPKDPAAYQRGQLVEPTQPIIYYLDPAIPAPYKEAFRQGGNWWAKAFEAAGFKNAFQVRDLPAGADVMDARYNMLMWVHRNSFGPSVGPTFQDPRTGEILRAVVRMDSYRSLVDYNIWAGLVPAAGSRGLNLDAEEFAMARRRQHTAHEIGHTLGLAHNFITSTQGRSSVMDYPFPLISVAANNTLDLSQAYAPMAGGWDSLAIRYGYTWYPNAQAEREGLAKIIAEGLQRGLRFVPDQNADPTGSIPGATRWDEGANAFESLERTMAVRRIAMNAFDERAIKPGEPMWLLSMRFLHVYLHHRYALEGVYKTVGGMDFRYAMRGDGQPPTTIIPAAEQRRALAMVLQAIEPGQLSVPNKVLAMIPPVAPGGDAGYDWLPRAGTAVDQVELAGGLVTEVIEGLMERDRLQRVAIFHARDRQNPPLAEVIEAILNSTWYAPMPTDTDGQALRRVARRVALNTMLDRAGDPRASADVRQVVGFFLDALKDRLESEADAGGLADRAQRLAAIREIEAFEDGEDDATKRTRYPVIVLPWP